MDVRHRRHNLFRRLRWLAVVCALAAIALAGVQDRAARGLHRHRRPSLPAAEQHESLPMPRGHVDRG